MTTTSKGPEGRSPHSVKLAARLSWTPKALTRLAAAIVLAAGGVLVLLDKLVELALNVPVWAFVAIIAASCIVYSPAQAVAPDNAIAPSGVVTVTYGNIRTKIHAQVR